MTFSHEKEDMMAMFGKKGD